MALEELEHMCCRPWCGCAHALIGFKKVFMAEPTCPERLARMIDWIVAEATAALTYRRSEVASNDVSAASEIADCSSELAFPTVFDTDTNIPQISHFS